MTVGYGAPTIDGDYPHASHSSPNTAASAPSLRARNSVYLPMARSQDMSGGNVKVVVRVRKFLPREIERGAECLVRMTPAKEETVLLPPGENDPANLRSSTRKIQEERAFIFDKSFWSHDTSDDHYADQEEIYNSLGEEMLDHNFEGYHTCVFAYGQTGSGKSYTMMGTPDSPGLIPRTCQDLFERIESAKHDQPNVSYNVRVSYFEVYNEHVRDLLVPRSDAPHFLKIRESPSDGPYVKDLTDHPVHNYVDIQSLMRKGDTSRTTASTKMNDTSSRSHAVFTIILKQIHADLATDETTERIARIRLVDLAGSERANATGAVGARLREGANINKSLTTLGRVIAALAESSAKTQSPKKRRPGTPQQVPFRDSVLTWLLKDSLGGNSKTAMVACIAPSDYDETLSTLRYADQAKKIRTSAIVNQDTTSSAERDAQIIAMQETIRDLQLSLAQHQEKEQAFADKALTSHASAAKAAAADIKRQQERQGAQLEQYREQCNRLQQMMEESRQVSECRITALRTENEALRLHLKLALDSLRNPVIVPPMKQEQEPTNTEEKPKEVIERKENARPADEGEEWDDGSDTDVDVDDAHVTDLQSEMETLLKDLGLFKRKMNDDRSRFFQGDAIGAVVL